VVAVNMPVYAPPCVHRLVFRSHLRPMAMDRLSDKLDQVTPLLSKQVANDQLLTASLFQWNDQLFFYCESLRTKLGASELLTPLDDLLETWPGEGTPRHWVPMMDIFHYSRPLSVDHWRRSEAPGEYTARIIYLRPEMVSSYIFYHFQLQEEQPGALGSKYGLISQHENLLFFYMEKPDVAESESYAGHLKTQHTPPNWGDVMDPHFQPWPDDEGERLWRPIECILAV